MAILGPGTGLGVAASIPAATGRCTVSSEGGHASLCSSDATEDRLLSVLRGWFGHVSFERVLSGAGIVNLYRANCALAGIEPASTMRPPFRISPRDRSTRAASPPSTSSSAFLGTFAGNLALTFDARGGVYLGGGIVPRLLERIESSSFRERFESKGRFRSHLERIPTASSSIPPRLRSWGRIRPWRSHREGRRRPSRRARATGARDFPSA